MKKKRVAAALCAVTLAGAMIAGCGGNDTAGGNDSGDNGNNHESYTVKILAPGDASTEDCEKISEADSKITEEKFNTKIEVTRVGFGSYDQQVNLMLASGEKLDLMYQYCGNVTSAIS